MVATLGSYIDMTYFITILICTALFNTQTTFRNLQNYETDEFHELLLLLTGMDLTCEQHRIIALENILNCQNI